MSDPIMEGLHYGMSAETYHDDPCPEPSLSASIIKEMLTRTPAHAAAMHPAFDSPAEADAEPKKTTRAMTRGTVAHKLLLGRGNEFETINHPDFRRAAAKAEKARVEGRGRTAILKDDADVARRAARAAIPQIQAIPGCENFLHPDARSEVVGIWKDEAGIWGRFMADKVFIAPDRSFVDIYDYKTTDRDASPGAMVSKAVNDWLQIPNAWYERGITHLIPEAAGRIRFWFLVQEMTAPYHLAAMNLDPVFMTLGRKQVGAAADLWKRCVEVNNFPAYHQRVVTVECPPWFETRWLERELNDDLIAGTGDDPLNARAPWIPTITKKLAAPC